MWNFKKKEMLSGRLTSLTHSIRSLEMTLKYATYLLDTPKIYVESGTLPCSVSNGGDIRAQECLSHRQTLINPCFRNVFVVGNGCDGIASYTFWRIALLLAYRFSLSSWEIDNHEMGGHRENDIQWRKKTFWSQVRSFRLRCRSLLLHRWSFRLPQMLNSPKTEVMFFSSCYSERSKSERPSVDFLRVGESIVNVTTSVKNLAGYFVQRLIQLKDRVKHVCQTTSFGLYKIGRIRKFLNHKATEKLVHAFITSKLDYCNSLLLGISDCELKKTAINSKHHRSNRHSST